MIRQRLAAALVLILSLAGTGSLMAADIFVIGGKEDDPFWTIVRRGVEDGARLVEAEQGSVTWLGLADYDDLGADAAALIRDAIRRGADGVIAPDWHPALMDPALAEVVAAGIPLVIYNAGGARAAERLGALAYIGSDDYLSGRMAGDYFASRGARRVVCINTLPGLENIADYCRGLGDGAAAAGAKGETLVLAPGSFGDRDQVGAAIKARLLAQPEIDGIFTVGNLDAMAALRAVNRAGKAGRVQVGSMNFDEGSLSSIRLGAQLFAVDQQGYLQGLIAVTVLNAHANFGLNLPAKEIRTGPAIVDRSNMDQVLRGVAKGVR
ncbi:substrate-binding domain-containing protein [Mangrovicoccus algicola]|uniref:Substrate-binding domain-containing protein n=1 Tax=Mangrovicoccus algicola TaxID=2771008 RepID=A0A8J6YV46_9RHOB|nr:substrate-binding domain-containing protein [Mangrovicoccus algicola]MBE3638350.1 substrate-binding domain-containing protein [Mangrovicoccus algicola]